MRARSKRNIANRNRILARAARCKLQAETLESRLLLASQPLDSALTSYFSPQSNNISSDLTSALSSVNTEVIAPLNGLNLPLIGTQLQKASGFVSDLSTQLQSALSTIQSTSPQTVADAINSAFGSGSGTISEITALQPQYFMGGSSNSPGTTAAGPTDTATNVVYNLDLKGTYTYSSNLNFNLGLPAVSLNATNLNPTVSIAYTFYLHFGVDDQGLYFDTNPSDTMFGGDSNVSPAGNTKVINFTAHIGLEAPNSTSPAMFQGTFGFLQLNAQDMLTTGNNPKFLFNGQTAPDNPGTTGFDAQFNVQFTNGGASGGLVQLAGNGISSLVPTVSLGGTAKVDLFMDLGFGDPNYPSVDAEFELSWMFGDSSANPESIPAGNGADAMSQTPKLEFNNVELSVGEFLGGFAKNLISDVGSILEPIAPLINVLNEPAPIFNDIGFLRDLVDQSSAGNDDGTATVGEVLGYLTGDDSIGTFGDGAADVLNVYNELKNFTASGNNTYISFGSFSVGNGAGGFDLRSSSNSLSALNTSNPSLFSTNNPSLSSLKNSFSNALNTAGSYSDPDAGDTATPLSGSVVDDLFGQGTSSEGTTGGGLTFPILDQPTSLFKLLLGQPVDLFDYTSPVLIVKGFSLDVSFPIIGPLSGVIKGTVNGSDVFDAEGQISVGYDTTGLTQFVSDHNPADLANGFFINTAINPATGNPFTSLSLEFGIGVGAELDLVVVKAGVTGGIDGSVSLSINGGNGARYYPFGNGVSSLLSALSITGHMDADLQAFVEVGIGPFSVEANFTLASIELFNLDSAPQSTPSLGNVDANGNLELYVGGDPNAPLQLDGDDIIHIDHTDGYTDPSTHISYETVTVTAKSNGPDPDPMSATFTKVRSITVEGGGGSNNIVIGPGVTSPVTAYTNYTPAQYADGYAPGHDYPSTIVDEGTGPYNLYGGEASDDTIVASGGDTTTPSAGGTIYPGSVDNTINVTGYTNAYSYAVVVEGLGLDNNIYIGPGIYSANITGGFGANVLDSSAYYSTMTASSGLPSLSDDFIVHAGITDPSSQFYDPASAGATYTLYPNGLSNTLEIVGAEVANDYTITANPLSNASLNTTVTDNYTLQAGLESYPKTETFNTDGYSGLEGVKGFQYLDVEGGASFNASNTQSGQTLDTYHIGDLTSTDLSGLYANALRSQTGVAADSYIYVTAPSTSQVNITGTQSTFNTSSTSVSAGGLYNINYGEEGGPATYVADGTGDTLVLDEAAGNVATSVNGEYDTGVLGIVCGTSGTNDITVSSAEVGPLQISTNGSTADVYVNVAGPAAAITVVTVGFDGSHQYQDGAATLNFDGTQFSSSPITSTLTDTALTLDNIERVAWVGPLLALNDTLSGGGETLTDSMASSHFPIDFACSQGNSQILASGASCPITVHGSAVPGGNDTVVGTGLGDYIHEVLGTNSITEVNASANGPWDSILGGSGNDSIFAYNENDTIDGGAGNDYIQAYGGNPSIDGGAGNDTIIYGVGFSSQPTPTLIGGEGSDTIIAYGGNPLIYTDTTAGSVAGQDGNDIVEGTANNATIYGGAGVDTFELGAGYTIFPGNGTTQTNNGFGPTSINFGTGTAYLYAGPSADSVYGGNAKDTLLGFNSAVDTPLLVATGILNDNAGVQGTMATVADVTVAAGATLALVSLDETIGSLAGAGTVALNGNTLTTGADGASTTFSGLITGSGSLIKAGTGTFILANSSTYSGSTTVNAGTLRDAYNNALPTSTDLTVATGAVFDLNNFPQTVGSLAGGGNVTLEVGTLTEGSDNASTTFSGVISSPTIGGITKNGTGTWTISGSSSYFGATAINSGVIQTVASNATSAASDWTVTAGGTLSLGSYNESIASLSGSGTVLLNGGGLTTGGDNANTTYTGVIIGSGSLIKVGTGTFQCVAPAFTGATNVQAGMFRTLSALSVAYLTNFTKNNNIYTNLNKQFPHTDNGTGIPGSGAGTANASFIFNPTPSVVAAAGYAPNYVTTSNLVNNGVTFDLTSDSAGHDFNQYGLGQTLTVPVNLNNVSNVYALIASGENQTVNVTFTGTNGLTQTFNNVTVPDFIGTTINSTGTNLSDQTLFQVNDVGSDGTGNSTTGTKGIYDLTELSFPLPSSFLNQQLTSASFTLSNYNGLFLGLSAVQQSAMPSGVTVTAGATFDTNSLTMSVGSLAGAGSVTLGTGALSIGTDNTNTTFSGVISNSGSVTKVGTGTWTVTAANSYTGSTSFSGGVVNFNTLSALGTGTALTFAGGTLQYAVGNTADISARTVTLGTGGGTIDTNGNNVTYANAIGNSGTGGLTKAGQGTLTLDAPGTWAASTTVNGGTLQGAVANVLPISTDLTVAAAGTFDLNSLNQSTGSLSGSGAVTMETATLTDGTGTNTNSSTFSGIISGSGKLIKTGASVLTLSGTNIYSGGTTINEESSSAAGVYGVSVSADVNLGAPTGNILFSSANGVLFVTASFATGRSIQLFADSTGSANYVNVVPAAATLTDNSVISNAITNTRQPQLIKAGTGTLMLNAVSTFGAPDGTTDLNILAGTIKLGIANAIPNISVAFSPIYPTFFTGVLDLNGFNLTLGGVNGGFDAGMQLGKITNSSANPSPAILTIDGNGYVNEYDGSITGPISLVLSNAAENFGGPSTGLVNTGSNYTGGTTILSGSMWGAFLSTGSVSTPVTGSFGIGPITVGASSGSANSTLELYGGATENNPIMLVSGNTGTDSLIAFGNGGNVFSGLVTLAHAVTIGGASFAGGIGGTGNVTISNSAGTDSVHSQPTIFPVASTYVGSTTVTNNSSVSIGINNALPIGTALIMQVGVSASSLSLTTFNLSVGSLTEAAGGDATHGAINLGTGNLTVGNDNTSTTFSGVISGTGAILKVGTGTWTITGAESYSGSTQVSGGALTIANGAASGSLASTSITVAAGAALNVNDNIGLNSSTLLISNGSTTFASSSGTGVLVRTLGSISIGSSGAVAVANAVNHAARTDLITGGLTFAGSASTGWQGKLDLANNDLDVNGGNLANINSQLAQGLGNGNWLGTAGIISSTAASDSTHLTALGGIQNSVDGTPTAAPLYGIGTTLGLFDGTNPANSDVLVKFTYLGDANLDGRVDGSDYTRIDFGVLHPSTGWFNGNFNYDKTIDGSDYTLIDNAFNTEGATLAVQVASNVVALYSPAGKTVQSGLGRKASTVDRHRLPGGFQYRAALPFTAVIPSTDHPLVSSSAPIDDTIFSILQNPGDALDKLKCR